jgi:hypothetical protein
MNLRLSPDGSRLAFTVRRNADVPDDPTGSAVPSHLYILDVATQEITEPFPAVNPAIAHWSPDGTRLAFFDYKTRANRMGHRILSICDLRTGRIEETKFGAFGGFSLSWLDDETLVFSDSRSFAFFLGGQTWITVWDVAHRCPQRRVRVGGSHYIQELAVVRGQNGEHTLLFQKQRIRLRKGVSPDTEYRLGTVNLLTFQRGADVFQERCILIGSSPTREYAAYIDCPEFWHHLKRVEAAVSQAAREAVAENVKGTAEQHSAKLLGIQRKAMEDIPWPLAGKLYRWSPKTGAEVVEPYLGLAQENGFGWSADSCLLYPTALPDGAQEVWAARTGKDDLTPLFRTEQAVSALAGDLGRGVVWAVVGDDLRRYDRAEDGTWSGRTLPIERGQTRE